MTTSSGEDPNRARTVRWRRSLGLIVLAGLLARGALLAVGSRSLDDPDNYLPLAHSLAEGRGFVFNGRPTAYRPPLYPLILASLIAVLGEHARWGVAGLHLALGAGTMILTAATARRWGLTPARALAAAAIVALDPVLVAQSKSVMTETLAAFLSAAALAAFALPGWRSPVFGGVALGLATLCRPSALAVAVLTAMAALVCNRGSWRACAATAGTILTVTALTLTPWAVRNALVIGSPIFTTTHGGYTLFLANNPVYYDEVVLGPPGAVWKGRNQQLWWDSINRSASGLSEPAADRLMRASALRVIGARPGDFLRASLARLGRFWGLAPAGAVYPRWLRVATALWTAPLWAALVLGLASPAAWRWPRATAPAMLLALSLVHSFYWTDLRMRAPAVPAIALIAASCRSRLRTSTDGPNDLV